MSVSESYDERLQRLGVDVTQLVYDEHGTIAPPIGTRDNALLAALPLLELVDSQQLDAQAKPGALKLGATLGSGGMGVVKEAFDTAIEREVAVKLISRELPTDVGALELLREARVTGRLAHPNIVPIYALGRDAAGHPLLVMKRIEGELWSEVLEEGEKSLDFHLDVLMQVSQAVHFAHSRGIIHRDLKPCNVMIGSFGEVYVLDWGIAVSIRDDDPLIGSAAGIDHIAGTPAYMAPEMAAVDAKNIDARTDVYLLGAVLCELLTGHAPHETDKVPEALALAFRSEPPDLDGAPAALAMVCHRAMNRLRTERFDDAASFRAAIADYLSSRALREITDDAFEALSRAERAADVRHADAARFGFRQALRMRPDDEVALQGRARVLEWFFDHHIARNNLQDAALVLNELGHRPDLNDRLVGAADVARAEKDRIARLDAIGRDHDPRIDAPQRIGLALTITFVTTMFAVAFIAIRIAELEMGHTELLVPLVVIALVVGLGWRRIRKDSARLSRQFINSLACVLCSMIAYVIIAMLTDVPMAETFSTLLLICAACVSIAAVLIDHRFFITAAVFAVAYVASLIIEQEALLCLGFGQVAAFASMAWVWRRAST